MEHYYIIFIVVYISIQLLKDANKLTTICINETKTIRKYYINI